MGIRFDVDVRYDVLDVVGQGAYGVVCAAHDAVAGEEPGRQAVEVVEPMLIPLQLVDEPPNI